MVVQKLKKEALQKPAIGYTYPQLLTQKTATRPGSIFNRQGGSIFNRREQRQHYYHPAMMGSWSIKAVLPTIAPDLRYDELEVGDGGDAQNAYSEIVHPEITEERKQQLTEGLREYCALDTLAMVRLAWFFEGNTRFRK